MHRELRPAHEMQVDYAGTQMHVVDIQSGEALKVYIFVARLPYSAELYAEGAYDTKEQAWIEAHIHAFSFFGGTPAVLVPDNLAQGITKNSRDELVLDDHARRMAEYYGCAVIPARPRKPRDKGAVESAVHLIEQNACAPLRDRVFVSLADLNGALLDKVRQINEQPFQKKDGSRDEIFFAQEKPYLTPLPMKPYEIVTRRRLTVNFNYHVSFDGGWYSVPYTYVK